MKTYNNLRLVLLLPVVMLVSCKKPSQPVDTIQVDDIALEAVIVKNEYIVSLSKELDLIELEKSLTKLAAKIETIGPKQNKLLKISVTSTLSVDEVIQTLNEIDGIINVQHNFVRELKQNDG